MNRRFLVGSILSAEQNQVRKPYVTGLTDFSSHKHRCFQQAITRRACFGGMKHYFTTSLTDGAKTGIGACIVLLLRDDVLLEPKHPSAPV